MAEKPLDEAIAELTETIKKLESKQSRSKPGKTFSDVMSGINVESFFPSVFSPIGRAGQGAANLIQGTMNQFRGKKLSSAQSELGELQSQQESDPSSDDEDSSSVLSSGDAVSGEGIVQENPVLVQDVNTPEDAVGEDMSRWAIVENIEHLVHDSYNCLLDIKKSLENGLKLETKEASNDKIKERDDKRVKAKEKRVETEEKRESSRPGGLMSSMKNMGIASLGAGAEATGGGGMGGMITSVLGSLGMSAILPIVTTIGAAVLAALGAIVSTIGLPVILGILGIGALITALFAFKDELGTLIEKMSEMAQMAYKFFFGETEESKDVVSSTFIPVDQFQQIPFDDPRTSTGMALKKQREVDALISNLPSITEGLEAFSQQPGQAQSFLEGFESKFQGQFGGPLRQSDRDQINAEPDPEKRKILEEQIIEQRRQEFFNSANNAKPTISSPFSGKTLDQIRNISTQKPSISSPSSPPRNVTPPEGVGTNRGGQSGTPVASAPNVVNQTTINNIENILRPDTLLRGTAFA
tara:strand:- start:284 stop:1861 length:1578 start_codon:yes stop_codon:yes gene_type:complete